METKISDYQENLYRYITVIKNGLYPEIMESLEIKYRDAFDEFYRLVDMNDDSVQLYRDIMNIESEKLRVNVLKIFRRMISPNTPVEMMRKKTKIEKTIESQQEYFRPLMELKGILSRGEYDKHELDRSLMAIMNESQNRGQSGYQLTGTFFEWFENKFGEYYEIFGPRGAGRDIDLTEYLDGISDDMPTDFIIKRIDDGEVVAIGYARYDSDRGGSQEDDRISGNRDKITKIKEFRSSHPKSNVKIIFLNDGPGLLLGSMFRDYVALEETYGDEIVMVSTLKMLDERLTRSWLES